MSLASQARYDQGMKARIVACLLAAGILPGCYHGDRAARGINSSWKGRSAAELEASWGKPVASEQSGPVTTLRFIHKSQRVETLPWAAASLHLGPDRIDAYGEIRPGMTSERSTEVTALVNDSGKVMSVHGPSLRWGASDHANLRYGLIMGMHAGIGRLDDTNRPLPSGGIYIGGMLGPTLALLGSYSLAAGSADAGSALGMAWSLGPQWWPHTRISLRAGPAMILAFDPGFEDLGLEAGLNASASYAIIRSGSFVLDLRADISAGPNTQFGSLGIGVNVN